MNELYHGTRRGFGPGGLVLPAEETAATPNHDLGLTDAGVWVHVTPDLELAWAYAHASRDRGRPRVLIVHPIGALYEDDTTLAGGEEQAAYRCEAATVLRVLNSEQ